MKVLITGISGKMGRLVAQTLLAAGHEVTGIDRRPWPNAPASVEVHQHDIRKRSAADVFRHFRPEAVIHMATVTHISMRSNEDRYRINLYGTRAVFEHCHNFGAKHAIFVGRHTYYGAAPDSPLYHREDEPPIALGAFPELADLVAADLFAGSALWRFPEVSTAVLRICYTLGPNRQGTLAGFLRGPKVPMVLGFDPLFQFLHEADTARAIQLAMEHGLRGVFNVAGPNPVPLSLLARETGNKPVRVPEPLFRLALGRFGLPKLPTGAVEHIKYPVVIDSSEFRKATDFVPAYDEDQTMRAYRDAALR
ncbi:SDR family oxidoreductase [Haliangium ochraceum]|uniref:NAD-dependent epimerase/dehydratase n=1 Tax=Haliangium ochraceum (strain DSM 14365 / JCM 11303 / SMP-2) TaxID=502025 RepID=D0LVE6_HALO1|nr:SDR family oxidoreductase [Haliangium ochraceum]ACY17507.1 NAD-dependent epimerase/dehydratase [Haliangium ochraceum DSM 14365]